MQIQYKIANYATPTRMHVCELDRTIHIVLIFVSASVVWYEHLSLN